MYKVVLHCQNLTIFVFQPHNVTYRINTSREGLSKNYHIWSDIIVVNTHQSKDTRLHFRKDRQYKLVSQSCAVAKSEKFWWATGQSNLAYKRLATTKASKVVFVLTQLHFGQWNSLPFCLSSLIVQCPARNFHF